MGTRTLIMFTLLALGFASIVAFAAPATTKLKLPSGKELTVELMIKDEERMLGLMFRPSLPQDRGLLFVFDRTDFHGIWMKNCKFPIDIVWLDEDRKVVHLAENVPACRKDPCPSYQPMRKARYVLEINARQARREKVAIGETLVFELPR